jgi:Cu-processing system permease protein
MWNIWHSEWRMTIRQHSSYTFVLLWVSVLSLLFLLERNTPAFTGYTNMTGTIANLVLYIVPLFMLIIGSFAIANEMENGQWRLLCTYPLSTSSYLIGKLAGQFTAQVVIFTLSFGASLAVGLISGSALSVKWVLILYLFSISLMFFFLVIGLAIGVFVATRWQALTLSVGVWFFLIMIWPSALIAILGLVPYSMIAPLLKTVLFCNPAEFLRIVFVVQLGGGAVFGQSYDGLVSFLQTGAAWGILGLYVFIYTSFLFILSAWKLKRRKGR